MTKDISRTKSKPAKQGKPVISPDAQPKAGKDNVALDERDLGQVSGGCATGKHLEV